VEVRYTVTLDDYVAFQLYFTRKAGVGRGAYLFLWFVVPAACALGALALLADNVNEFSLVVAGCLALVGFGFAIIYPRMYWALLDHLTRAYALKMDTLGITGECVMILSEEGLVEISETTRTEVRWRYIRSVDVVGDYTFVFITGVSAWILPRQGFESDAEYEAARDFALRKLAARVH
jgi:hypothetical protein